MKGAESVDEREPTRDQVRSRRKRGVRAVTIGLRRITKKSIELGLAMYPPTDHGRPRTRGECEDGARPCPFVSCRYHLYLDVTRTGIKLNFPDLEPDQLPETCALDVAEHGGEPLEVVGELVNVTRERCRQIEVRAFAKVQAATDLVALADVEQRTPCRAHHHDDEEPGE